MGQMVRDQKISGTAKLVSMDWIPPALGVALNLEREVSATNKTHEMVISTLIPQGLIKECALQNSLFLSE